MKNQSQRVVYWTKYLIPTLKETPQEAQVKSHRLMLRAGIIRKLASGTYTYLPLGFRSLQKAEAVVREEMDRIGALQVLLPAIHPSELWKETGRYDILGEDMIHFRDRHGKHNVLGPTHEEVITDLARREIHSYKQLPVTLYQIQTKFRDEMRPRSGVIRSREFIMKDAYSFHATPESLDKTYCDMLDAYTKIFTRCGLKFFVVKADPGAMGGSGSQEFILFSDAGEDWMVQRGNSDEVVSVEMAERRLKGLKPSSDKGVSRKKKVPTPGHSSVEGVAAFLGKKPQDLVKTMIYEAGSKVFAVLVRGDHEVSEFKVKKSEPLARLASIETIEKCGSAFGFSGPFGLSGMPFYIDEDVLSMKDFVTGANEKGVHYLEVNLADIVDDLPDRPIVFGDFRQVVQGDKGVNGEELHFKTAIELGHIFKLNLRYSDPMKAVFIDTEGNEKPMIMGCYGIGVNRILAAAVEQSATEKSLLWPKNIAPFAVHVVLMDPDDEKALSVLKSLTDDPKLLEAGVDFLVDDRKDASAGVKFNDADLVGIPLRVILGPKNLKADKAEIKILKTQEVRLVDLKDLPKQIMECLDSLE